MKSRFSIRFIQRLHSNSVYQAHKIIYYRFIWLAWVWKRTLDRNSYMTIDVLHTHLCRLIDAACYGVFRVYGNHLDGIFIQLNKKRNVTFPRTNVQETKSKAKAKKRVKRVQMQTWEGIALSHSSLAVICDTNVNTGHGFFTAFKLIRSHVWKRYRNANWILFIYDMNCIKLEG